MIWFFGKNLVFVSRWTNLVNSVGDSVARVILDCHHSGLSSCGSRGNNGSGSNSWESSIGSRDSSIGGCESSIRSREASIGESIGDSSYGSNRSNGSVGSQEIVSCKNSPLLTNWSNGSGGSNR